jgi:hypothetical protein
LTIFIIIVHTCTLFCFKTDAVNTIDNDVAFQRFECCYFCKLIIIIFFKWCISYQYPTSYSNDGGNSVFCHIQQNASAFLVNFLALYVIKLICLNYCCNINKHHTNIWYNFKMFTNIEYPKHIWIKVLHTFID